MAKGVVILSMTFLLLVYFLLFLYGLFHYEDAGYLFSFERRICIPILCGISLTFFILLYLCAGSIFSRCSQRMLKILCVLFCIGALLIQGYFLFYVRSYYKWDSGFVIGAAASLAKEGRVADEALYYLSVYPNQNTFVLITSLLVKAGDFLGIAIADRPLLFNLFNTVCLDTAMILTFPILKKCGMKLPLWKCTQILLLMLCNPFLYLGVSYYYTITLSLPLTQGFLYFALSALKEEKETRHRVITGILGGIFLGIGYELRATAIIFAIAFGLVFVWKVWNNGKEKLKQNLIYICVIGLAACIAAVGLAGMQKTYIGLDTTDTAFPTTHWLMMSLTMPGGHNEEDEIYTASFPTAAEKKTAVMERLTEKLDAMSITDYLALVKTKLTRTFGNGLNGYPTFLSDAFHTDGLYEWIFGSRKDLTVLWHQGFYLFMLLGVIIGGIALIKSLFTKAGGQRLPFCLLALILVGALLFYILWEAGEQYSVPFMTVMWMAGLLGWQELRTLPLTERSQAGLFSLAAFLAAAFILVWGIFRFDEMTDVPVSYSHPVAAQILANGSYAVDDGEMLVQEIEAGEAFDRLIIQWRNPAQEKSSARYQVTLYEKKTKTTVFQTEILGEGTGYNGAGIYDLEGSADAGSYELMVEKTGGKQSDDLEFVYYDMYGYQAYPGGNLYVIAEGKETKLESSMLFSVSAERESPYMQKISYAIFTSILFLIFLFMGFWCKLKIVSFT